jgi:hypothetical protein
LGKGGRDAPMFRTEAEQGAPGASVSFEKVAAPPRRRIGWPGVAAAAAVPARATASVVLSMLVRGANAIGARILGGG